MNAVHSIISISNQPITFYFYSPYPQITIRLGLNKVQYPLRLTLKKSEEKCQKRESPLPGRREVQKMLCVVEYINKITIFTTVMGKNCVVILIYNQLPPCSTIYKLRSRSTMWHHDLMFWDPPSSANVKTQRLWESSRSQVSHMYWCECYKEGSSMSPPTF